jgi:hypothetical protein
MHQQTMQRNDLIEDDLVLNNSKLFLDDGVHSLNPRASNG